MERFHGSDTAMLKQTMVKQCYEAERSGSED